MGGRGQRARVRTGARLRDRVAPGALAAKRRLEVPGALRRRGVDQGVVRAGDVRPEATRHLAELLVDEDLLQRRPALAADRLRKRSTMQPGLDGGPPEVAALLPRQAAVRPLELVLERLEHLPRVRPRPAL